MHRKYLQDSTEEYIHIPLMKYFTIDLYDGVPCQISKELFDARRRGLGRGKQGLGVRTWLSEKQLLVQVG